MTEVEEARAKGLLEAQKKAETLFHEIEARGLIRPSISESALNADIYALAKEMYGITTYWHKRIVRAGKNTLLPTPKIRPILLLEKMTFCFSTWGRSLRNGRRTLGGPLCSATIH